MKYTAAKARNPINVRCAGHACMVSLARRCNRRVAMVPRRKVSPTFTRLKEAIVVIIVDKCVMFLCHVGPDPGIIFLATEQQPTNTSVVKQTFMAMGSDTPVMYVYPG